MTLSFKKPFIAVVFIVVLASCGSPSTNQSPPVNPPANPTKRL